MAEVLKRWDGTAWQTVASVNRVEVVGGGAGGDSFISFISPSIHSIFETPDSPPGGWVSITTISDSGIAVF